MHFATWLKQMLCQWQANSLLFCTVHIISDTSISNYGIIEFKTDKTRLLYEPLAGKTLIPEERLVFTEELRLSHESHIQDATDKTHSNQYQCSELKQFVAPVLLKWLKKDNLHMVELGPAFTTIIPETLEEKLLSYCAVDFSPPYLKKQQELLQQNQRLAPRTRSIISDTYDLVLPEASADIIFTSCHPPLVSASAEDKCKVLSKIHHFLAPNGILVVFPWYFNEQPQTVTIHLLKLFHVRCIAHKNRAQKRALLILEKC